MKIVAVTQRIDEFPKRNEIRDAVDQRLIEFVFQCGYLPLPVPNVLQGSSAEMSSSQDGLDEWILRSDPQAIVLSGGNDIGQFPGRDKTELRLLDYAEDKQLPVLGICRGMEMIAARAGIDLVDRPGHVRTRHKLHGNIVATVNSYHTKVLSRCPDDFSVTACSEDNSIEAIKHHSLPWEGWMWHPEREQKFDTADIVRLRDLFGG